MNRIVFLLLLVAQVSHAEIYTWTDHTGHRYFSDRVPAGVIAKRHTHSKIVVTHLHPYRSEYRVEKGNEVSKGTLEKRSAKHKRPQIKTTEDRYYPYYPVYRQRPLLTVNQKLRAYNRYKRYMSSKYYSGLPHRNAYPAYHNRHKRDYRARSGRPYIEYNSSKWRIILR